MNEQRPAHLAWVRRGTWVLSRNGAARDWEDVDPDDVPTLWLPPPDDGQEMYKFAVYDPLTETPYLFMDFISLGELCWTARSELTSNVVEAIREFTTNYGQLNTTPPPTLAEISEEAQTFARLALGHQILNGELEQLDEWRVRTSVQLGSEFDPPKDEYEVRMMIARDIEERVNRHMSVYAVHSQIRTVPDGKKLIGFEPTFSPSTLRSALWAQFAKFLIDRSLIRVCAFVECRRRFAVSSPTSRKRYCDRQQYGSQNCQRLANERKRQRDKKRNRKLSMGTEVSGG